jgi:ectoine hydroxylase-related dioxygenase (phytanoyl-CoA dioxygenase family)
MTDRAGYSIHDDVFTRDEMGAAIQALDGAELARTRAGARHVLRVPAVWAIADDPRLLAIARGHLDAAAAFPFRATLFVKSASANWLVVWHQDTALPLVARVAHPAWGPWSVKAGVRYAIAPAAALSRVVALRVHLDDSTPDNGPLRVLPGTHQLGVLEDTAIQALAARIAPVPCVSPAGGVVAMRPLLAHASSKAIDDRPRRVLHIEYASTLDLGDGATLAVG